MQDWVIKSRSFPMSPSRADSPASGPELTAATLAGTAIKGGEAVAAIARWLDMRRGQPEETTRQIDRVLCALRESVSVLVASPVLRDDAVAARLIDELARAETIEDFDVVLTELAARVLDLSGRKRTGVPEMPLERQRPVRTLLKL